MGLLDKTNPWATRQSIIHQAILWGAITSGVCLAACLWQPALRPYWAALLPAATAFGAGIGALMEWQMDDGPDKPNEEDWRKSLDATEPGIDLDEDRTAWDQAWRAMPHRRLESSPRIDVGREFGDHFGDLLSVTISLDPPEYSQRTWRESESCPVCGDPTTGSERLPASLHPIFASGFRYGLGVWVHRTCFENCRDTGEPAPIPW